MPRFLVFSNPSKTEVKLWFPLMEFQLSPIWHFSARGLELY